MRKLERPIAAPDRECCVRHDIDIMVTMVYNNLPPSFQFLDI